MKKNFLTFTSFIIVFSFLLFMLQIVTFFWNQKIFQGKWFDSQLIPIIISTIGIFIIGLELLIVVIFLFFNNKKEKNGN
jgi:hypothetical protein